MLTKGKNFSELHSKADSNAHDIYADKSLSPHAFHSTYVKQNKIFKNLFV